MLKPTMPLDETQRLLSLHSLRILDTPSEARYDRITRMAKRLFNVDICLVSLVDSNRQWFKSRQGLDACETSREISFCGHAILDDEPFIVCDTARDERFADNPLVTAAPFIRFYAGCPIKNPDGYRIGTLCIIDPKPREMTSEDIGRTGIFRPRWLQSRKRHTRPCGWRRTPAALCEAAGQMLPHGGC